jgi:hypothetical protein
VIWAAPAIWFHPEVGPAAISYVEIPGDGFDDTHAWGVGASVGVGLGIRLATRVVLYGALTWAHAWDDEATLDAGSLAVGALYTLQPGLYGGIGVAAMVIDWESAPQRRTQGGVAPGFTLRAGKEWPRGGWTLGVGFRLETSLRVHSNGSREYDERWGTVGVLFAATR